MTPPPDSSSLSPATFHVLLVLAEADLYGYAILKAIEEESGGRVAPEIGSLYRMLARLMDEGLVREASAPADDSGLHRGRPRRYYALTPAGREVLRGETRRMESALRLAQRRLGAEGSGG